MPLKSKWLKHHIGPLIFKKEKEKNIAVKIRYLLKAVVFKKKVPSSLLDLLTNSGVRYLL